MIEAVASPSGAPPAGPYSPALRVGDLLFVSGQGPFDAAGQRCGQTFAEQAHAVFDNLAALAAAAGTGLDRAVRLGAYLSDHAHFGEWNRVCAARLSEPYPARTTVPVALPGFDIEADAVFWIPEPEDRA
ncbi:RidA family protein [Catenulispora sp. NL8]|uniref:RidA family protein n=1 Tax=Catenulispora pinistramenti TaxID=2705254 RepID=A0ABS5KPN4_9ACTN|nr:RidA family protein [Catenulispora pinistramenti]MBS2547996.1 RidA family protein [Catenulispora pinistramenti]